jgi:uncharacterized protein (TIGR03067 family)
MKRLGLAILLGTCLGPFLRAEDDPADSARLCGEWRVVEGARAGRAFAKDDLRRWRVIFHDPQKNLGGQFVELPAALCRDGARLHYGALGGQPLGGAFRYHLSVKGSQRRIRLAEASPPGLRPSAPEYTGIYQLEGDRLKLCLNLGPWEKPARAARPGDRSSPREAWPEKFEAAKGSGFTLLTLKRVNAAK